MVTTLTQRSREFPWSSGSFGLDFKFDVGYITNYNYYSEAL